MYSIAPADVFPTTAVSPTLLLLGIITPCAPAHSAVRIIAPRLCGSVILSSIIIKGFSPFDSAELIISSTSAYSCSDTIAITP